MSRIFLISLLVKTAMLAFGLLAYFGHEWALAVFAIVGAVSVLSDILVTVLTHAYENDNKTSNT